MSIVLPAQHFWEHPEFPMDDVLDLAAAAPTTLVFVLPSDVDEFDLGDEGLLGLCEQLLLVIDSTFHVPARATLRPTEGSWLMGSRPEVLEGRGSLWRAKLVGPVVEGVLRVHLQLTEVAHADTPAWDVLPSTADLRRMIEVSGMLVASRFDFSPIGVSARIRGPVDLGAFMPPEDRVLLDSYQHDIDFGRDTRVRVVSQGHLSSGHAASLVQVRRRIFIGGSPDVGFAMEESVAFLETVRTIVVTEPVVDVDGLADAYGGPARDMPLRALRMVTTSIAGVDDPLADAGGLHPFWVQVGGRDFRFALQGTDWAGNVVPFDLPLVFIPRDSSPDEFAETFADAGGRVTADVGSVSIALLAPETAAARDVAPLTVEAVEFGFQLALPSVSGSPVLPVLSKLRVVVDAAAHFSGVRTAVDAVWHEAYRDSGLDESANTLGSYLHLPTPLPIDFGDPSKIGGLARPDMKIAALTVLKGAVPAGFDPRQELDLDAIKRQFATAKVLGTIPLTEIVDFDKLLDPNTLSADMPPELKKRIGPPELKERITREQAELTYTFSAPIRGDDNPSVLKAAGPKSAIELTANVVRRFADGATTSSVSGRITDVKISIGEIVTLSFAALKFTADPGKSATIEQDGMKLSFGGDLVFLQELSKQLESLGLGGVTVRVGTDQITAGFAVTVPALSMGMFSLSNLSVSALLTIPFDGRPLQFTFGIGERFKPFRAMVSLFTGGGFFALTMSSERIERVEAALEFGGSMQLNLVVASGGLSVMAGIYFRLDADGATLGGYVHATGQVTVLGIITISADFFMQLSYQESTNEAIGQASLTLGIKVLFFSKSVTLNVERRFSATLGDPTFSECYDVEDWVEYCDAFA